MMGLATTLCRLAATALPICIAELAAGAALPMNPVLSPGPIVIVRSWLRSRLVLKNEPMGLTLALVSFHEGVMPPLVVISNFMS